jgi:amino acid permease
MSSHNLITNCSESEFTDIDVAEKKSIVDTNASFVSENEPTSETHLQTITNIIRWPFEFSQNKLPNGSMKGSVFILINSTIGASILSLPLAIMKSGLYLGLLQFIGFACIGYFTTMLLVQCADISKKYSYMELASATYGKSMTFFVKLTFFLCNWGFVVAFIVLINKLLAHASSQFFPNSLPDFMIDPNGKFWACMVIFLYAIPMSLFRTLTSIRFTFILGLFFVLYMTVAVVFESTDQNLCNISENYLDSNKFIFQGILGTLPIAIFSFTCHPNVLDVYKELKTQSRKKMSRVLFYVMMMASLLYSLVGIFGYLTFSQRADELEEPNKGGIILLANYNNSIIMKISLLVICFSVLFTFPLNIKPAKDSLNDLLFPNQKKDNNFKHFSLTFVVAISSLLAAMLIKNMGYVLILMGSTINPLISFFFPCMFYFKYANYKSQCWKRKLKRAFAFLLIILTLLLMVFGVLDFFDVFESWKQFK